MDTLDDVVAPLDWFEIVIQSPHEELVPDALSVAVEALIERSGYVVAKLARAHFLYQKTALKGLVGECLAGSNDLGTEDIVCLYLESALALGAKHWHALLVSSVQNLHDFRAHIRELEVGFVYDKRPLNLVDNSKYRTRSSCSACEYGLITNDSNSLKKT